MIYSDPDNPEHIFRSRITFDGNWLIMTITKSTSPVNKTWIAKLEGRGLPASGTDLNILR